MRWLSLAVAHGFCVLVAAGCGGPDHGRFCEEAIRCAGGNDLDNEACVEQLDLDRRNADAQGCSDEYDEFFDCSIEEAECTDVPTGVGCFDDASCTDQGVGGVCLNGQCVLKSFAVQDQTLCETERNAFDRCIQIGTTPIF